MCHRNNLSIATPVREKNSCYIRGSTYLRHLKFPHLPLNYIPLMATALFLGDQLPITSTTARICIAHRKNGCRDFLRHLAFMPSAQDKWVDSLTVYSPAKAPQHLTGQLLSPFPDTSIRENPVRPREFGDLHLLGPTFRLCNAYLSSVVSVTTNAALRIQPSLCNFLSLTPSSLFSLSLN